MATALIERRKIDGELSVPWPHRGQQRLLDRALTHTGPETLLLHGICGRGWGKSVVACDLAQALLNRGPEQRGVIFEPDWDTIYDVFLETWDDMIPSSRFHRNERKSTIFWHNGASLKYRPRVITGSRERIKNKSRGRNLTFVIDDEAALGFDLEQYLNTLMCLRGPISVGGRIYAFLTTPKIGQYINVSRQPGHIVLNHPSYENPGLDPDMIQQWKDTMSPAMFEREVLAMVRALTGRLWDMVDLEHEWPNGNLDTLHPRFNPALPYWIGADTGSATGAYVLLQKPSKRWGDRDDRWVIVADFCPVTDGNVRRCLEVVKQHFGTPAGFAAGVGLNTRSDGDGSTPAYFVQKVFGNIPILACDESAFTKQIQYDVTTSAFATATGRRRLTVARDIVSLDTDSHRGIREMIQEDCWLEPDKRRPGDVLPKNKEILVQHARDALLMIVSSVINTPQWAKEAA